MNSQTYRQTISRIIRNTMVKQFPGLKKQLLLQVSADIAKTIHARMYGAAVDSVASPIWRDDPNYGSEFSDAKVTRTAQEILDGA